MKMSLVKFQRGVGLIEILVTVLIISTALMGLAALQARSLQYNQGSYFRSQANIMAADALDRMRIYTSDSTVWEGALTKDKLPPIGSEAENDIRRWGLNVKASLPSGNGALACEMTTRICTATITWTNLNNSGQASDDTSRFVYTAKL